VLGARGAAAVEEEGALPECVEGVAEGEGTTLVMVGAVGLCDLMSKITMSLMKVMSEIFSIIIMICRA
jgi:hypothetical protein